MGAHIGTPLRRSIPGLGEGAGGGESSSDVGAYRDTPLHRIQTGAARRAPTKIGSRIGENGRNGSYVGLFRSRFSTR